MDTSRIKPVEELAGSVEQEQFIPADSRKEALRYVPFENLLKTGRAVKKSGHSIVVHTAGEQPRRIEIRHRTGKDAKKTQAVLLAELRKARTDYVYNKIIEDFLRAIDRRRQAAAVDNELELPDNLPVPELRDAEERHQEQHPKWDGKHPIQVRHVQKVSPENADAAVADFDWSGHRMIEAETLLDVTSEDEICPCNPDLDAVNINIDGTVFVVHKPFVTAEEF